jgi:hypothetical protein
MRKILIFFSLLTKKFPKFGVKVLTQTDFLIKLFPFFEEEAIDFLSEVLPVAKADSKARQILSQMFKVLFFVEQPSWFLILSTNHPTFFPKFISFLNLQKTPELAGFLASHFLLAKPFIYFGVPTVQPELFDDRVNDPRLDGEHPPSPSQKLLVHLSLSESELIRRVL